MVAFQLRIDNCWRSVICAFGRISEINLGKDTYVTLNERTYFSQSFDINGILLKL